ncbi:Os09g0343400, partial [Oryza sativa Japonica Group]
LLAFKIFPKYNNFFSSILFPTNHNPPLFNFSIYLHIPFNHNILSFNSTNFLNNRIQR